LTASPEGTPKPCLSLWERWRVVRRDGEGYRGDSRGATERAVIALALSVILCGLTAPPKGKPEGKESKIIFRRYLI